MVNSFSTAIGLPTLTQSSQGAPEELPVTSAELRITITNYNTGVGFWNGAFSGSLVVCYQAFVANPANPSKPGSTPAVFSGTFTATGAISMR